MADEVKGTGEIYDADFSGDGGLGRSEICVLADLSGDTGLPRENVGIVGEAV